jgi:Ca2+-binding RTX toxin-like protein
MADDYAGSTATTGTVSIGGSRSGTIETGSDTDWFKVVLTQGATYQFDLEGAATSRGTLANPFMRLRDSAGNWITFDDNSGTGANARISGFVASYSGTYYLSVGPSDATTGTYRLSATQTAAPPSNTSYTITPSATSMYEGGRVTFTITRSGDLPSETVYFSAWAESASFVAGDYRMLSGAKPENIAVIFSSGDKTETMTMEILQDGVADAGERFRAVVQKGPPAPDPGVNAAQTGYITITNPAASYSLTPASTSVAEGNTSITFTVTRSGDQPEEMIYASTLFGTAAAGDLVDFINKPILLSFGDSTETFSVTLKDDTVGEPIEQFKVLIGRGDATVAQALDISEISITDNDSPAPGTSDNVREGTDTTATLLLGTARNGTIDAEPISGDGVTSDQQGGLVDKDWYKVTLDPGKIYTFDAKALSITAGTVVISLYDPTETRIKGPVEGSAPSFTFDMSGQTTSRVYYLAVSAGGPEPGWRTATGNYTIGMTAGAAPPPAPDDYRDEDTETNSPLGSISMTDPVTTGVIGPADSNDARGDKDVFKVSLTQGQTYIFTMSGAIVNGFGPLSDSIFTIRKAGSFSTIEATSTEGSTAVMEFFAVTGGDYYIRTGSGGATYTTDQGGYRLEMRQPHEGSSDFDPGNTFNNSFSISAAISSSGAYSYTGQVGGGDPADLFQLRAPRAGQLTVDLTTLSADIDLSILDSSGDRKPDAVSDNPGTASEHLSITLAAGETIYLNVTPYTSGPGGYSLNVRFGAASPPPVPTLPSSSSLIGNHLHRTLAEFAAGAYGDTDGSTARSNLMAEGWSFYASDNVQGTSLSGLPWSGIFYSKSVAQAVLARSADGLVISFRGTNGWADVPHWAEMDEHLRLFGDLVAAVNELIINDTTIRHVFVTGHSLGAAMVDPFMATHPNFQRSDGSFVDFRAITFAHPDFQTGGTEAVFNGALTAFRKGLPTGLYTTFKLLHDGVPDFGPDSRVVSYHNYLDPIRQWDFQNDGLIPKLENLIRYTSSVGSAHDKQLYVYAADFLARSGVGDSVTEAGLNGFKKNEFLIPSPGSNNTTLTSTTGGLLMVGGTGDDIYVVTANGLYSGDTIIEYTNASAVVGDTLRLTSGFGAFNGNVRLVPTKNGMDLLVYPVSAGPTGHALPYIRIYNQFTVLGRVEWIEWGGNRVSLPASVGAIDDWNNAYYKVVSAASISYLEDSDGSLVPRITATGGPGSTDTVSFQPLKSGSVTADIEKLEAAIREGFSFSQKSMSLAAAAESDTTISVDITGMENIIGSGGGDDLTGSAGPNALDGGDGDDRLNGGLGNDYLEGGSGVDTLAGGGGEDLLDGGPGADAMTGGADSDVYFVDDGADVVVEGESEGAADRILTSVSYGLGSRVHVEILSAANDAGSIPLSLAGNELDNRIIGNAGANTLYGMGGIDRLEGLEGDDSYVVERAEDVVVEAAGQGHDTVFSSGTYTLASGSEVEAVSTLDRLGTQAIDFTGNEFRNALYGNAGANRLSGGAGDDILDGGVGDDRLDGGADVDTASYAQATSAVTVSLALAIAQNTGGAGMDTLIEIEELIGSAFADTLTGNSSDNVLSGLGGGDLLRLHDGGNDAALGGTGNDIFFYGGALTAADLNDGGEGSDTLVLQGDHDLTLGASSLTGIEGISIQSGSVTRWGQSGANSYDYALRTVDANVAAGQQLRLNAQSLKSGEDLTFDGSAETDGSFFIYAGFGTDTLTGGAGRDIFFFEAGRFGAGDRVNGGGGADAVVISGAPAGVDPLSLTIAAGSLSNVESISFNGRFASDPSATPSYELVLEAGNVAPGARLIINANSLGAGQRLSFDGSAETAGFFDLIGGAGGDRLVGSGAGDRLTGGGGADTLRGGGGGDTFRYFATSDSAVGSADRIQDFSFGSDLVHLGAIDADVATAGDQAFAFIGGERFGRVAGQLRAEQRGASEWLIQGDVNGDGTADFELLVTMANPGSFAASDFVL